MKVSEIAAWHYERQLKVKESEDCKSQRNCSLALRKAVEVTETSRACARRDSLQKNDLHVCWRSACGMRETRASIRAKSEG